MAVEIGRPIRRRAVSRPPLQGPETRKGIEPIFKSELGQLYRADCLDLIHYLADTNTVLDMVFADPPYNVGKADWDNFDPETYLAWVVEWIGAVEPLIRDAGSLFVMGYPETLADVKYLVTRKVKGFTSCRWLTWHYRNKPSLNSHDWVRSQEAILHLRKGVKFTFNLDDVREPYNSHTLNYPGHEHGLTSQYGDGRDEAGNVYVWTPANGGAKPRDVLAIPAISNSQVGEQAKHPTRKPEELLRKLVLATTDKGQTVFDPFGGSGTTFAACEQMGRRWIGGETEPAYCRMIEDRVRTLPRHPLSYWLGIDKAREVNRSKVRGKSIGARLS